ncbi:MAG: CAP domain-containing protein, partial [Tepidiformaceae bacterium]
ASSAQAVTVASRASADAGLVSGTPPRVVTQASPIATGTPPIPPGATNAAILLAASATSVPANDVAAATAVAPASTPGVATVPAADPATPQPTTPGAPAASVGTLPQQTLPTPTPVTVATLAVNSLDKSGALLDLMNSARIQANLPALTPDPTLADVALTRANNLIQNGYFDHYSPEGESAFTELAARGVTYHLAGENLARNNYIDSQTVQAAFDALMASPGHRANILEPRFAEVGVAAVLSGRMWIYVTVFKD